MTPPDSRLRTPQFVAVGAFWFFLWLLGYPQPFVDDLYFLGPAINLAHGHGYANPYFPGLAAVGASDHFYVYVPLHAYTVAGWIKLFGLSRASLDFFICTVGALGSFFLFHLYGCRQLKTFSALLIALFVAIILCWSGQRPDALGLTLFLGGCLVLRAETPLHVFLHSLCLFLAVICSPNFLVLALVVALAALYFRHPKLWPLTRPLTRDAVLIGLAGLLAFVLFLAMIHFDLPGFLKVFVPFSALNRKLVVAAFMAKAVKVTLYYAVVICFTLGVLILVKLKAGWIDFKLSWAMIAAFVAGLMGVLATYFTSAKGFLWLDSYLTLLVLFVILRLQAPRPVVIVLALLYLVPFFLHRGDTLAQLFVMRFEAPRFYEPELAAQASALNPDRIFVDPFAAAAVYDYQLPGNVYDINCPLESGYALRPKNLAEFPAKSVLIVSPVYMYNDFYDSISTEISSRASHKWAASRYDFLVLPTP